MLSCSVSKNDLKACFVLVSYDQYKLFRESQPVVTTGHLSIKFQSNKKAIR